MAKKYYTGKMDFERLHQKFYRVQVKSAMAAQEFSRQMAVRALNVVLKWTPPNQNVNASENPRQEGIKALKKRIAEDLIYAPHPLSTTPRKLKNGTFALGELDGFMGRGGFPFVIPKTGKVRGQMSDPESVIRRYGKFQTKKGCVRMVYKGPEKTVFFVTAGALKKAIARRQKHAGNLISGWYPTAVALRLSTLSNYSPAGHAKAGNYKVTAFPARAQNQPSADYAIDSTNSVQSSPLVARWVRGQMAKQLDTRIALAQSGLFLTRLKAIGKEIAYNQNIA